MKFITRVEKNTQNQEHNKCPTKTYQLKSLRKRETQMAIHKMGSQKDHSQKTATAAVNHWSSQ
jgi:hypothetical protein